MKDGDQAANFLWLLAAIVLVGSSLFSRRLPFGSVLKMLLSWVLIFGAAFIIFTMKDDFADLGRRLLTDVRGDATPVAGAGQEIRIRQALDGHFWVDGTLNGQKVRFLVDSGATTTSISTETAKRAGVSARGGLPALVQTANGIVTVQRGRAESLVVGDIRRENLAVHMSDAFGDMNVLGMNFLSSLSGWGVEGRWLILKP
ncbi:retropepsin-like aspartic protease family protein [Allosphingosinicella indica]|uniref:Aspartyl protease family protein n=1 Tax=Allosphingosinicella indica TaxID=941907 RepID=A0A1X7GYD3_9SPHN|nr:TIGR02281 family clan AA aspartic protease [Allosphingosinicella indica]SMF76684.1 aspartyl protease family protein [Allosphingosinicella indica]